MNRSILALGAGLVLLTIAAAYDLQPADADRLWRTQNSRLEVADGVYRWHLEAGKPAELTIHPDHPLLGQLRDFDYLRYELRIAAGEVSGMNLLLLGHVSGPRQYKVHDWQAAILTTPKGVWHRRCLELARPNWFPWDQADGQRVERFLRFTAVGLAPDTVIELRGLTLTRGLIRLKPDFEPPVTWPRLRRDDAGNAVYTLKVQVLNQANRPLDIAAAVLSEHEHFRVAVAPAKAENVKNGKVAVFTVTATLPRAAEQRLGALAAEPLALSFTPGDAPEAEVWWAGELVRPLSAGLKRQVIIAEDDLAWLRQQLPADQALRQTIGADQVIAGADAFLEKELLRLPTGHLHVSNRYPPDWLPGDRMPEIVHRETQEKQFDTALAARTWKEYLGNKGRAAEHLALAYLYTGDERYARKAGALLDLYAQQYTELTWGSFFEPKWSDGPAILASSRVALSSTYGTNWYFKGHCRLLSAIAESPSWDEARRTRVYEGFVLPYATEVMKFDGGISNMTDISNHNIMLLGLAFGDAGLVRWALYSDPGLLRRLEDLTPDGFSSEGRPVNYHLAAMAEYLPALTFLDQSGLAVDFPRERLLAAVRMPFQRANLAGYIPATGDSARGYKLRPLGEADWLVGMFPDEDWLLDVGRIQALPAQLAAHRLDRKPVKDGWRQHLETAPRLFPDAGYAILRRGETVEEQVMVTLDYGRNPMHAHLDRNTISLSAFGHLYSQGPGSTYNIGRGGMTRNQELDALIGPGSLFQNVVLVDGLDQQPGVGKLLNWEVAEGRQTVVARVPGIRPGVDHTRAVWLQGGVVIVVDQLTSAEEHQYDFVYHNFGDLSLGNGWTATAHPEALGRTRDFESLRDVRRLTGEGPVHLRWHVAEGAHLALWQLAAGQAYTATGAMNNLQTRIIPQAAPTLIHRQRGRTVRYVTVLEPFRDTPRVTGLTLDDQGRLHLPGTDLAPLDLTKLLD